MFDLKRTICPLLVVATLASAGAAQAATYYVDSLLPGNNSNAGTTEGVPLLTIQAGLNKATNPGDTVLVKNGTYNSSVQILFKFSGTAGKPITLKNYPGHTPVVDFSSLVGSQRILVSSASGFLDSVSYGVIEGLEIKGGNTGIKIDNADHFIIRLNNIHDNAQGIFSNGGYEITIERNRISHNGDFALCATTPSECNKQHGMYLQGSSFTVINNLIYNNLAYGLVITGHAYDSSLHSDANHAGANNWLVANNTFSYQVHRGGISMWDRNISNSIIENNIFYENSQLYDASSQGIDFTSCCGSGNIVRNNMSYCTGNSKSFTAGTGSGLSISSTTNANPLMINAPAAVSTSPNFRLTSSSPAINAGLNLTADGVTTDYDGNGRPMSGAWSIGAYDGTSSNVPPSAPQGLVAQ